MWFRINPAYQCHFHFFIFYCLWPFSTGRVGLCFFVVLCPGTPEGSTGSDSGFKGSQKTGHRTDWEKPGIEPETPGLQDIGLSPTPWRLLFTLFYIFCGFPGYKPVPPGWFKIVCWFYVGNTQRLTESDFMEKPGIEPATPGLQGIAFIHYTTAAFLYFYQEHFRML